MKKKIQKWEVEDLDPFNLATNSCTKITNNADQLMDHGELPTWEKVKVIIEAELDEYKELSDEDRETIINGMHSGYSQIYQANGWLE